MRHRDHALTRLVAVVFAGSVLLGAAASSSPSEIQALVKDGKLDDAIAKGRAAVQAKPSDPELRMALAHALAAKGRSIHRVVSTTVDGKDLVAGKVALPAINPDKPPRAEVRYDPALFEEAAKNVREAVKLSPKRTDLRLEQCYLLTDAGDVDGALQAVRGALAALPHAGSLGTDLAAFGIERAKRGDPPGGATLLQPVAAAFPNDAAIAVDYGYILGQAGKKAEALKALNRALALAPTDLRVLRRRTTALMLLREFKLARAGWQAAFELSREDGERLGAAAAAIAFDAKTAKSELHELGAPAASADPALVDLAADLYTAASSPAAAAQNVSIAKKLADGKKELLALPILHRALAADRGLKDAAALLAGIERAFDFTAAADEILRNAQAPAAAPKPASKPGKKSP